MPPLQVPGAAQVRLMWTTPGGGIMINVLGAAVSGSPTFGQAHANSLGSAIKGSFASSGMNARVHTGVSLVSIGVKDLRSQSLTEFLDQNAPVAGTATGDRLPGNVAFCVTLRTNLSGPRYRGRVYLGGFAEADNEADASATSALAATAVAFITAVQGNMASNGLSLGVISRPHEAVTVTTVTHLNDGTDRTEVDEHAGRPGQVNVVTLIQARNDVWDSQRRRTTPGAISSLFAPLVSSDIESGQVFRTGKASAAAPPRR